MTVGELIEVLADIVADVEKLTGEKVEVVELSLRELKLPRKNHFREVEDETETD